MMNENPAMTKINRICSIFKFTLKKTFTLCAVSGLLLLYVAASKEDAVQLFKSWFKRYQKGEISLSQPSAVPVAGEDGGNLQFFRDDNLKEMDLLLDQLARQNDLQATQLLVDAACFRFKRQSDVEIEKYHQEQPWLLRAHALEALQHVTDPESMEWLRNRCLNNGTGWESAFRRIIAASLFDTDNMLKDPSLLVSLLDDRDPQVQTKALEGLGRVGSQAELEAVIAMTDNKRPLVRVAALESVGGILARGENSASNLAQQYLPILTRHLDDQEWPVQETILSMMERFRSGKSIPILIAFLERISLNPKEYRVRIVQRITEVLRSLTGAPIQETDPEKWKRWWKENEEGFELAPTPLLSLHGFQLDAPSFFDIPVNSDHVYFILDIS
ncbi:MAG: HEAT repeat domain-containing protein, partial [Planctomycetota bacterium]